MRPQNRLQQERALAQQQQSYARDLSNLRSQQERALAVQEQSYARELSNLRSQQDQQLEVLRHQEERNSEALRVMLTTQSQLAARRVLAYANVWAAYGDFFKQVAHIPLPDFADDIRHEDEPTLRTAIRTFEQTFSVEKIFLDPETTSDLDSIIGSLSIAVESPRGKTIVQNAYNRMRTFKGRYRVRMETALAKSPLLSH